MKSFTFPKKKRTYNEAFYKTNDYTQLAHKVLKFNLDKKNIISLISNIKLEEITIKKSIKMSIY
jgi:hypothetical protein